MRRKSRKTEPTAEAEHLKNLLATDKPHLALAMVQDVHPDTAWLKDPVQMMKATTTHLTGHNFSEKPLLYKACEDILKVIVEMAEDNHAVLFELLELIETCKDDNVVVSGMKALQSCLLKHWDYPAHTLEWCLNSLRIYMHYLKFKRPFLRYLDYEEERLLEENDEVRRSLSFYFYVFLFYEPILQRIVISRQQELAKNPHLLMKNNLGTTQTNVLISFIIQLFKRPLAILDLSSKSDFDKKFRGNTSSRECVIKLIEHLAQLMPNPYNLMEYVELQERRPLKNCSISDLIDTPKPVQNIFRVPKKAPPLGISILFYVLIAEDMMPATAPKIYNPLYVFEKCLYMVTFLLRSVEHSIHYKGIRLCAQLLKNMGAQKIENETLDLDIHTKFVDALVEVLNKTQARRNSEEGIKLLKSYIGQFKTVNAQHFHIRRLLQTVKNSKICAFVATLYKDLVAAEINSAERKGQQCSPLCSGIELRSILMDCICVLPKGIETDLLETKELITTALSFMLFLALRDRNNVTGFWDILPDLERKYLQQLRTALDCSRAHYRIEKTRIQENKDHGMNLLEVNSLKSSEFISMTKENKIHALSIGLNTFDLIELSMSRLTEIIESNRPKAHGENSN